MQRVKIDNSGTELAYIDSGAPPSSSYTTLVCIHGITYHSHRHLITSIQEIFSRLFPLAPKYNLRVIALNRRDYVGSTAFSEEDLQTLKEGDDNARNEFLKARGLEIARFLAWAVKELKIPSASDGGKTGGLGLLGWSLGNTVVMAFLANLTSYPEDTVKTLEPYLTTVLLYDPSNVLGYSRPEGTYHIIEDTTLSDRIKGIKFGQWVSTYYEHPAYSFSSGGPLKRSVDGLEQRIPKPNRPCTLDKMTPRELLDCLDAEPWSRSDLAFWWLPAPPLHSQTERAMILGSGLSSTEDTTAALPKLRIRLLYGTASLWTVHWEVWEFERDCSKWTTEGRAIRPIKVVPLEGANHFMHWDDAEPFMKACSENMKS